MTRNLLHIPDELQLKVLVTLDRSSLATLCHISKALSAKATPLLWRDIELEADMRLAQRFFISCDSTIDKEPERWQELAALIHSLNIGSLPGIAIPIGLEPYDAFPQDGLAWVGEFSKKHCERSIYHIISYLTNLEELHLFLVQPFDVDDGFFNFARPEELAFPRLKRLYVGGCIHKEVLEALFDSPEGLEECSCFFPQPATADQGCGPPQTIFLRGLGSPFTSLTTLHLCKLACLTNHDEYIEFVDAENDRDVLEDWAAFFKRASGSIVNLTLENRYYKPSSREFDGYSHSLFTGKAVEGQQEDWSLDSRNRFQEILLPVIVEIPWPKLRSLTLVGTDIAEQNKRVTDALTESQPQVKIRFETAKLVEWNYDATPLVIDAPDGYFDGCCLPVIL